MMIVIKNIHKKINKIFNKVIINKNKKAREVFQNFSASARREYADWIGEAKTDATQHKRLTEAMEWIAEGKQRNWKYMKK